MTKLTSSEQQFLIENFRLAVSARDEDVTELTQLLDVEFVQAYVEQTKSVLGTDYQFAAASLLMKRLGFMLTVPALYAMTMYDKQLNLHLSNGAIVSKFRGDLWLPELLLHDRSVGQKGDLDREAWREQVVNDLFASVADIIVTVSSAIGVPKPILWENVAVYVYWLYETRIEAAVPNRAEDFHYLIETAPASAFGQTRNPLGQYYKSEQQPDEVRRRRTCCFYYAANEEGKCCTTCPKSKQQLRKMPFK
ncbi:IucA/IucC family C-terminal-domain containing protein [Radiobacillus sp. PE A8.2]|uniref:IucA/IucC family C-terminal-domain containing protein n=1 Tax=Radiobacillus sp. PE A8.2 TaxID=3380349 RepID=UPI0038911859